MKKKKLNYYAVALAGKNYEKKFKNKS